MLVSDVSGSDILNRVNDFYNSAWNDLVTYILLGVGVLGIMFPVAIEFFFQWLHKKKFRKRQRKFAEQVNKSISQIKEEIGNLNTLTAKIENKVTGRIFEEMGMKNFDDKDYYNGLDNILRALDYFFEAKELLRIQLLLGLMSGEFIRHLTKKDVTFLINDNYHSLEGFFERINAIKIINPEKYIDTIKKAIEKLP